MKGKGYVRVCAVVLLGFFCIAPLGARTFSVLYFNVWSGLANSGVFVSESLEDPGAHEFRQALLVSGLKALNPDIVVLSELNPLPDQVSLVSETLDYTAVFHGEKGGLRIGPVGLPVNLYQGSGIFSRPDLTLSRAGRGQLEGGFVTESVFAGSASQVLVGKLILEGQELFVAMTNWKESLYDTRADFATLVELQKSGKMTVREMTNSMEDATKAREERLEQAQMTLDYINKIVGTAPVILSGTLNCEIGSPEMAVLLKGGFRDAWLAIGGSGITRDEISNSNIKDKQPDLHGAGPGRERVDYILYRGKGLTPVSSRIVFSTPTYDTYPSDHAGILVRFSNGR